MIKNSPCHPKFAQRGEPPEVAPLGQSPRPHFSPHATSLRVSPSPRHSYHKYLGGHDITDSPLAVIEMVDANDVKILVTCSD